MVIDKDFGGMIALHVCTGKLVLPSSLYTWPGLRKFQLFASWLIFSRWWSTMKYAA
jgi:hypothetical protein